MLTTQFLAILVGQVGVEPEAGVSPITIVRQSDEYVNGAAFSVALRALANPSSFLPALPQNQPARSLFEQAAPNVLTSSNQNAWNAAMNAPFWGRTPDQIDTCDDLLIGG